MQKPQESEELSQPPTRQEGMTPADRWERQHRDYWHESFFAVEWSSASVIAGLEIPVVGGMVGLALDHSLEATIAMMEHPDPQLPMDRRHRVRPPREDAGHRPAHVPRPRCHPLRGHSTAASRAREAWASSIREIQHHPDRRLARLDLLWAGIPLAGRNLPDALERAIRSICDGVEQHDVASQEVNDVALSYRGRFLGRRQVHAIGPRRHAFRPARLRRPAPSLPARRPRQSHVPCSCRRPRTDPSVRPRPSPPFHIEE